MKLLKWSTSKLYLKIIYFIIQQINYNAVSVILRLLSVWDSLIVGGAGYLNSGRTHCTGIWMWRDKTWLWYKTPSTRAASNLLASLYVASKAGLLVGSGAAYPAESRGKTVVSRTQPSTGKEVTVGYELRGSSQAAGIKGLAHSRCCCLSTLCREWSFLYWGLCQAVQHWA